MISESVIFFVFSILVALFLSGVWGEMALSDHPWLPNPASFDMDRAAQHPRFVHIWSTPILTAGMIAFTGYLLSGLPPLEELRATLDVWAITTICAMASWQAFALWRLNRWTH